MFISDTNCIRRNFRCILSAYKIQNIRNASNLLLTEFGVIQWSSSLWKPCGQLNILKCFVLVTAANVFYHNFVRFLSPNIHVSVVFSGSTLHFSNLSNRYLLWTSECIMQCIFFVHSRLTSNRPKPQPTKPNPVIQRLSIRLQATTHLLQTVLNDNADPDFVPLEDSQFIDRLHSLWDRESKKRLSNPTSTSPSLDAKVPNEYFSGVSNPSI